MSDAFKTLQKSLVTPLTRIKKIAPGEASDTVDLDFVSRAILVTGGVLVVEMPDGEGGEAIVTFADGDLTAGIWHPVRIKKVRATDGNSPAISTAATVYIGE